MAQDLVGTPRKLVLDGNTFFYIADADIQDMRPKWATEAISHSGGQMWKMTKQSTESGGHKIKANAAELLVIKALAERPKSFPMSYTSIAGETWASNGHISYDNRSAANGSVELTLIPEADWTLFLG